MPSFDANKARAVLSGSINAQSDKIALALEDFEADTTFSPDAKVNTFAALVRIVTDSNALRALEAGTYSQITGTAMATAPANAGSSATTLSPSAQRVAELFDAADPGQQQATIRVLNTGDPAQLRVSYNGTPVMVAQLQDAWDDDHDPNHDGSQAQENYDLKREVADLKRQLAALPAGTGMVPQADLDAANATAKANLDAATTAQADLATAKTALADLKTKARAQVTNLNLDSVESAGLGDKKVSIKVSLATVRAAARSLDTLTS